MELNQASQTDKNEDEEAWGLDFYARSNYFLLDNEKSNDFLDDYIENIFKDIDIPQPDVDSESDQDWSYEEHRRKE